MTSTLNPPTAPATLAGTPTEVPAKPCAYSIGRRLSLLLATQTVIGLGVLLAVIYGITVMLFQAKHNEQMQGYTHVLADMMQSANERAGAGQAGLVGRAPARYVSGGEPHRWQRVLQRPTTHLRCGRQNRQVQQLSRR